MSNILLNYLQLIANEPVELSHDKVRLQRDWFQKLAREALEQYHNPPKERELTPEEQQIFHNALRRSSKVVAVAKPLDDDF